MMSGSAIAISSQPPWRARTISTLSPGLSTVSDHAERGTTDPLRATAIPRWATSTSLSASSAASVAATSGSTSPFTRIPMVSDSCVMTLNLFRGARRRKAFDPEGPDRGLDRSVQHEPGDHVGSHRCEQDAVAMVAGGIDQSWHRSRPEDGRIVAAAGPVADPHVLDRQFLDGGNGPPGCFQKRQQTARRQCRVERLLFDGGADDEASVPPRHEVDAGRPDHVADERRGRIHAQGQHLALDRPYRRPQLSRNPTDDAGPGAGRKHHGLSWDLSAVGHDHAVGTPADDRNFLDQSMFANGRARALGGNAQRRHELTVFNLVIFGAEHRARELAGKMRLAPPRFHRRDPLQRQAELLLKHKMMVEPCLVVRSQGHDQGAFGAQFDVDARGLHQVGGKRRPARLAVAAKRNERLLAGLGLAAGSQHSGRRIGGAAAGCAAIEDLDGRAAGSEPPGNAEAHDARANDGDLRFAGGRDAVRQAAAPFAGMTQTGSMGVFSAASLAAPQAVSLNDGDSGVTSQVPQWDGMRWRSRLAQTRPTSSTDTAPVSRLASSPNRAKP